MNPITQSTRGFNVIFIHSSLDDAGLSVAEFRVLAHLSRRASSGQAWPSIATIAEKCRIHEKTVRSAIKALQSHNVVQIQTRPGNTNVYHITDADSWNFGLLAKSNPCQNEPAHPSQKDTVYPSQNEPAHPSQKDTGEGNPLKEIHEGKEKGAGVEWLELPVSLQEPAFIEAWKAYVQHRKEKRQKLTPTAAAAALNKCARFGVARATIALWNSVENGWQGIFEPKDRVNRVASRAEIKPSEDGKF